MLTLALFGSSLQFKIYLHYICLDFTVKQWNSFMARKELINKASREGLPLEIPKKVFKQTHTNIPQMQDYSKALDSKYWDTWEKKTYSDLTPARSWVCPTKLWDVANRLHYKDLNGRLQRAIDRLHRGASIGCEGDGRLPTSKPNSDSAAEYGVRVADSLQSWIERGLCFGPLLPHEMPWATYTINPITVKLKPNGKARVCINMSAPYKKDSDPPGTPSSVNSGIDISKFPATISTSQSFLHSLMLAGSPAEMAKLDWTEVGVYIQTQME